MAQDTTPALVIYPGQLVNNTYQTNFEFAFDKGFYGEVKVAFVRRGLTEYEHNPSSDLYDIHGYLYAWNGGVYTKTETATTDTPLYDKDGVATGDMWEEGMYREPKNDIISNGYVEWKGNPITENDIICIVRETRKDQPYTYPNNQKHIERALDNLSRQIQELQLTADNALKVDPSWNYTMDDERKMDPIAWLQTIVRSKGLTLRELRVNGNYAEYTTDDPDSETKTWNVLAGVKAGDAGIVSHIRESQILAEDGITYIPFLEYSVDGGNTWKPAGRGQSELEHLYVKKSGDTMTGVLMFKYANSGGAIEGESNGLKFSRIGAKGALIEQFRTSTGCLYCGGPSGLRLGTTTYPIVNIYTPKINNGYDIDVPVTAAADTLALKSQVDLAANSGTQLRDKGVWYAKMDAATIPPSSAGVEGRNYADFTQVDAENNPIIVIYTYTSGDWVQTETITPPAAYNGYLPITSKFWDIQEQTGQQGGLVLWSYSTKTFTPYPRIISTDGIAITNSTFSNGTLTNVITTMPANPVDKTVANKKYVDDAVAAMQAYLPDLFDFKWKDCTMTKTGWKLSDGNWINKADAQTAYQNLADDITGKTLQSETVGSTTIQFYLADNGHKICPDSEESNVAAIYTATGVAWYYVVDTTNERFKLPRTQYGFVGSRGNVGNYVPETLPNVEGSLTNVSSSRLGGITATGAFTATYRGQTAASGNDVKENVYDISFSAHDSNNVYDGSSPVQQRATQMYLYFYVGQ